MPKVSIIMPVYNGEIYIREAIESILNQTFTDWELLIINEFGSSESATAILHEYESIDTRIKIIQNTARLRIAASMNVGLKMAKGEYIARMDSDDISLPTRLEKQVAFLDKNSDFGMCGTLIEVFGSDNFEWELENNSEQLATDILFYSPCVHPTVMIRKSILDENGLEYNPQFKATEDFELFSKICEVSKVINLSEVLFRYRISNNNATVRNNDIGLKLYNQVMKDQFELLGLNFNESELKLLSPHYSVKGMQNEQVIDALIDLDLLLKKILVANYKSKKYDVKFLFKTLRKRYHETYNSISWACKNYDADKNKEIYLRTIWQHDNFYPGFKIDANYDTLVTVLMPTFNSEKYVIDTIWSILNQTFPYFEFLIINEFDSNDDTILIAKMFQDDRVRIIQNVKKLGLADSLNLGLKEAKGKYIARIDADDLAHSQRLEKQYDFLEKNIEYGVYGSWQHHFGKQVNHIHKLPLLHEDLKAEFIYNCELCHSTLMLRKEYFIKNNLFYDNSFAAEDYELWTRAIHIFKFANTAEVLGEYRVNEDNITTQKLNRLSTESGIIAKRNIEKYLGVKVPIEHEQFLTGWQNEFNKIQSKEEYNAILNTEKELLINIWNGNKKINIYDEDSLLRVINRRWRWVTNQWTWGTDLGEVLSIENLFDNKVQVQDHYAVAKTARIQSRFKIRFKNILKFFYRPIKNKIIMPIRYQIWDLDGHVKDACNEIKQIIWDHDGHFKDEIEDLKNNFIKIEKQNIIFQQNIKLLHQENQNMQQIYNSLLSERLDVVNQLILDMKSALESDKQTILQTIDSRIWKSEENILQTIDGRIWKSEENILQTIDGRIWKAEIENKQNVDDIQNKAKEEIHRHIDFTYRDLMVVLERYHRFIIKKNITLQTNHPIAYDSNDYLVPHGTMRDNTRYPRFIKKCEQVLKDKQELSFLDLGCSGGGMVLEAALNGHFAMGLEGSDYSLIQQRAEWRLLGDNLQTCDITKEFRILDKDINEINKFDIITAWEVMEHIKEEDLSQLFLNIKNHLHDGGYFVASIANWDDIDEETGTNWHVTTNPYEWWKNKFEEKGFIVCTEKFEVLDLARGGYNPPHCYESMYSDVDKEKNFYIVVTNKK